MNKRTRQKARSFYLLVTIILVPECKNIIAFFIHVIRITGYQYVIGMRFYKFVLKCKTIGEAHVIRIKAGYPWGLGNSQTYIQCFHKPHIGVADYSYPRVAISV